MKKLLIALMITTLGLSGCVGSSIPKEALALHPQSLADRQVQTRRFETTNYEMMLSAASAVFQDLGFTLEESEYELGILVGSKQRDATSGAQIAGSILMAALFGVQTHVDSNQIIRVALVMRELTPADAENIPQKLTPEVLQQIQKETARAVAQGLRAHFPQEISERIAQHIARDTATTLTTDLSKIMRSMDGGESSVRVTFQRVIYNTAGQVTLREQINEPELYQQFFDQLSKAVFLEAHEI